ncbi:unnamed protein product, partial [Trichobilharzia regenti]
LIIFIDTSSQLVNQSVVFCFSNFFSARNRPPPPRPAPPVTRNLSNPNNQPNSIAIEGSETYQTGDSLNLLSQVNKNDESVIKIFTSSSHSATTSPVHESLTKLNTTTIIPNELFVQHDTGLHTVSSCVDLNCRDNLSLQFNNSETNRISSTNDLIGFEMENMNLNSTDESPVRVVTSSTVIPPPLPPRLPTSEFDYS